MRYIIIILIMLTGVIPAQTQRQLRLNRLNKQIEFELNDIEEKNINGEQLVGIYFQDSGQLDYFRSLGIKYIREMGVYYRGRVSKEDYANIRRSKSLDWVKLSYSKTNIPKFRIDMNENKKIKDKSYKPNIDKASMRVHATIARAAAETDGEGVIIGIIDSGIDVEHPAFFDVDGNTRILKYWDQTEFDPNPTGCVADFIYGKEYTQQDINNGDCDAGDEIGHGTFVASIAAGSDYNTNGGQYLGIAPKADLVIVKIHPNAEQDQLDALDYIECIAESESKPFVINYSRGKEIGPKDGTSPVEYGFGFAANPTQPSSSYFRENGCIVVSAGNSQLRGIHAHQEHSITTYVEVRDLSPYPQAKKYGTLYIYYPSSSEYNLSIKAPTTGVVCYDNYGEEIKDHNGQTQLLENIILGPGEGTEGTYYTSAANITITNENWDIIEKPFPETHFSMAVINFMPPSNSTQVETGTWELNFEHVYGETGYFVEATNGFLFSIPYADSDKHFLSEPSNAENVFCVGGIVTRTSWESVAGHQTDPNNYQIDDVWIHSCKGPTRHETPIMKPDVMAPAAWLIGAKSMDYNTIASDKIVADTYRQYCVDEGTSYAAPIVAGSLALVFSKFRRSDPFFTRDDAMARIRSTTDPDNYYENFFLNVARALCEFEDCWEMITNDFPCSPYKNDK